MNYSNKAGYEGLFYKFKVILSAEQRSSILKTVKQDSRVYEVSGFELCVGSDIKEYTFAQTLTYSGYALGYGPANATTSTLSCTANGIKDVLHLDVTPTFYRPNGTNGKNEYTQDSLHSVYFAVPNEMISQFGEMTAVHATWLNAVLKPSLVMGNSTVYNTYNKHLGSDSINSCSYGAFGAYDHFIVGADVDAYHYGYAINEQKFIFRYGGDAFQPYGYDKDVSKLYMLFNSGSSTDI